LLQTRGTLSSTAKSEEYRHRAPGNIHDRKLQLDLQCAMMDTAELACSSNGCKVLADGMRGRTCRQYCSDQGLSCTGAWEEVNDDCNVKATMTCDQTWGDTSDLLCECAPPAGPLVPREQSRLRLVWSDEFDGDGLDNSKWSAVNKGGGFGNSEQQFYTGRADNVALRDGVLRITAKCEEYNGHRFTSAKLQTKGRAQWGPGHHVEVRARLPRGRGTWPAIWMLPVTNVFGNWPRSGEIDIVEAVGCEESRIFGTVHTESFNHMKHTEKFNKLSTDVTEWHTYGIEWTNAGITWFMDGKIYHFFPHNSQSSDDWPFDREFFLILNVAVGGSWGGMCVRSGPSCSAQDEFGREQYLEVDYARVYAI